MRKNRAKILAIACVAYFLFCTPAFAATPDPGFGKFLIGIVEHFLVPPAEWLNQIWDTVGPKGVNLGKYIQLFSGFLLFLGIIWSGLRIVTLGGTIELQGFLVRSLIAGSLVLSGPWMGDLLRNEWIVCYKWSHDNITTKATNEAIAELKNLSITMGTLSIAYIGAPVVAEAIKVGTGKNIDEAKKDAAVNVQNNANTILDLVKYIVFSISAIVTVEYVVVILSGFAIIIASLIIPLAGVLLIFPGNALQGWFATWLKSASAAILIVLLHPIAYAAAMHLGFTLPARNFNESLKTAGEKLQSSYNSLIALVPNGDITQTLGYFKNAFTNASNAVSGLVGAATTVLFGTVTSIIMLFIGIAFAVMFVYAAQTQIMAFIGSIVGGGGGKDNAFSGVGAAGLAIAGGAAGAISSSFGGGGSSSSTPGGGGGSGGGSGGGGSDGSSPGGGGGMSDAEAQQTIKDYDAAEDQKWADYEKGGPSPRSPTGSGGGPSSGAARSGGGASPGAGQAGGAAAGEAGEAAAAAEELAPLLLL